MAKLRLLRRLLLGLLVLLVAGIAALYVVGRMARVRPAATDPLGPLDRGGDTQVGEGFDHTVSHEGKPLFRIRGLRDRRDREGNLHVEQVLITLFRRDGSRYEMAADHGTYSLEQREARLQGAVRLEGADGFSMEGEVLELLHAGTTLQSQGAVRFRYGGSTPLEGRAESFRAAPDEGLYVFGDGVTVTAAPGSESPFRLEAARLTFHRQERILRAEGEVQAHWSDSDLRAERIAVHLHAEHDSVELVRAQFHVLAQLNRSEEVRDTSPWWRLVATGQSLSLLFDAQTRQPLEAELQGEEGRPGEVRLVDNQGGRTDVTASHLHIDFEAGEPAAVLASGGVRVLERLPEGSPVGAVPRRASGAEARARLDAGGEVVFLELTGEATLRQGERAVFADRLVSTSSRTEGIGSPVVLLSERGELRAPRLELFQDTGVAHATGGVTARLLPGAGNPIEGTPLAETGEPVQVVAREAFWQDDPQAFLFRGEVRAWSGDRLLRAEQLRGEVAEQRLSAAGRVETVFFTPATERRGAQQVRVTASTLAYAADQRVMSYQGDVQAVEGERTLASDHLEVRLSEQGQAEHLVATGKVRLADPANGRSVAAEQADYNLADERVVFLGQPVHLLDRQGGEVTGRRVIYSTVTGRVTVAGEEALREGGPQAATPSSGDPVAGVAVGSRR
jgi:lipopolysaccharide transport protein LptA